VQIGSARCHGFHDSPLSPKKKMRIAARSTPTDCRISPEKIFLKKNKNYFICIVI
jgi:hypothetical protein